MLANNSAFEFWDRGRASAGVLFRGTVLRRGGTAILLSFGGRVNGVALISQRTGCPGSGTVVDVGASVPARALWEEHDFRACLRGAEGCQTASLLSFRDGFSPREPALSGVEGNLLLPGLRGCPELKASAWAESAGNKEKVVCVRAVG